MKTRKLVRRAFFTAALSTASLVPSVNSHLIAFESGMRASGSSIQLVQYQPGQSPPVNSQPNPAVTAELKRMFEENGQPMPSMNPQDLPNAQGQQASTIRPTQRPGMQPNGMQQGRVTQTAATQSAPKSQSKPQAPAEKNILKRFMSKVTGKEKKAAEAAVVPPIPPGYCAPATAPPSGGVSKVQTQNAGQGTPAQGQQGMAQTYPGGQRMNPNGQRNNFQPQGSGVRGVAARPASSSQSSPVNSRPQPNTGTAAAAPVRTSQGGPPAGQVRAVSQPSQPVPAVPNIVRTPGKSVPQQVPVKTPQYVQPGAAPGFMPSARSAAAAVVQNPLKAEPRPQAAVVASPRSEDQFKDLFNEADADADDTLDLDSLVEKPAARITEPAEVSEPAEVTETLKSVQTDSPANASEQNPFGESETQSLDAATENNPLTGVRLESADENLFGPPDALRTLPSVDSVASEADAGAPIADFQNSLPAIDLPAVEDLTQTEEAAPVQTDLGLPDLDAAEAGMPLAPVPVPASAQADGFDPAKETVKTVEAPPALKSVNTEKLQQVAEQDRRVRQQRVIQSRVGQAGFKGFCPVELRDRRELVETDPQFSATFGLQSYTFSSAATKTAFEADPSRYSPAAGGSDVVLLVNSGEEQPGMLDYALWYRDRLYLFRSRETMALFNSDPLRFANQY